MLITKRQRIYRLLCEILEFREKIRQKSHEIHKSLLEIPKFKYSAKQIVYLFSPDYSFDLLKLAYKLTISRKSGSKS